MKRKRIMIDKWQLKQRASLPLDAKEGLSLLRIRQAYDATRGRLYVSVSGGKDSLVLLHLVRRFYGRTDVPAVFIDEGMAFPEVREAAMKVADVVLKPAMPFTKVIEKYGWPVVSKEVSQQIHEARTSKSVKLVCKRLFGDNNRYKSGRIPIKWRPLLQAPFSISHKCCDVLKKRPAKKYESETGRVPLVGTMATDSLLRKQSYLRHGCNSFDTKRPRSMPMAFWTQEDVWGYVKKYGIEVPSVYKKYSHTGCIFCVFGAHLEKHPNKFELLRKTHPQLWNYAMFKLGLAEVLEFLGMDYGLEEEFR